MSVKLSTMTASRRSAAYRMRLPIRASVCMASPRVAGGPAGEESGGAGSGEGNYLKDTVSIGDSGPQMLVTTFWSRLS